MIDFVLSYLPLLNLIILNCGLALSQYVVLRAGVFSVAPRVLPRSAPIRRAF